jgi:heterodisulfide reductase subunit B
MQALTVAQPAAADGVAEYIRRETGDNVFLCYQCVKCTSGCPVVEHFDLTPTQVIRSLQFDDASALESEAIWQCASCYTCSARCPMEIDVAGVMRALCLESKRRGIRPALPDVDRFNTAFAWVVKRFGRIHEMTLVVLFNLLRRKPLGDWRTGVEMLKRRRLRLLPRFVRPRKKVERIGGSGEQIAYFPGCAGESHAEEYNHSARAAAEVLGLELVEPPNWTCCGSCHVEGADPELAHVLPLQTVSNVEQMGLDTLTSPCSECFVRLRSSEQRAARDPQLASKLGEQTGYTYQGGVEVTHLLSTILERAGMAKIEARVKKPLEGLKVACYYGCLMTRPTQVTQAEHPEYPMTMDALLRALGAEPVDWASKTECCGNSLTLTQPSVGEDMTRKILKDASESGADAIVAMCPLCHTNLDLRQRALGLSEERPVFYATQLMALAFGLGPEATLLDKHSVDPRPLLAEKGLLD